MVDPVRQVSPWLPEARWLPVESAWAKEMLAAESVSGQQSPRVAASVLLHPSRSAAGTIASIDAQWVGAELLQIQSKPGDESWLAVLNKHLLSSRDDWIALLDTGDELTPDAIFRIQQAITAHPEWQVIYTDEDSLTADGQHVNPHCKPDFNIDYLRSLPYIGGLLLVKKELFAALGGFDPAADGAEDYDLVLRAWEQVGDEGIGHIPEVLYHRLQGGGHCNKSIEEILAASKGALERHLQRLGIAAEVLPGPFPPSTRVRYPLSATPLVSIIIPTRNQVAILQRCVESIIEKTRYPHYEILIVDNDSDEVEARNYLDLLSAQEESLGGRLRVLRHPGPFNFSAMNNRAVEEARGDLILLLNNDTAALHEDWLEEMVSHALRPEVGIVGAKLLFPDGKIQHAGVILGMKGPAEHPFIGQAAEYRGYFGRAMLTQDLSAVTGACLLVSKALYRDVGGLDEERFQVSYNDVDLCLKVRERGKKIVFTPWAILMHEGSASQRGEVEKKPSPEKEKRFASEKMAFYRKWLPQLAFDPAYNRHLSLASTDFLLEDQAALTWDPDWRPRPRILVHPADREGCGEYRIISPMRALQRGGRVQGWETMRIFEPAEMKRFAPDSIVVQRQMEWPQIEALERHKALSKAFRVFEIDDLITNLPVKSLHKAHIHKDIAKRFRKAAGLCNRLVVATEPLAQAYKGFSDEVRVQPNCVEDAIWGALRPQRRGGPKPRVGWAGGVGHTGDLEMIADVVRDLANEVEWVFFGLCPDALRPYVHEVHGGVPLPQYPAKLASLDLDLALAPLEDNPFNEAKSHLRLLEYGILGYPVVCSDVYPYQGDFPVVRVNNRYRDWMRAIREAVSDRQALAEMGNHLREKVRAHWLLENHLDDWLAAWLP
ncbi:glycosyltransferase [Acidithiobacillus sp. AMEEHan]|uniref:glycosyltransferase n=1 Tax=Acidithiobacillus sp. AMEEHan TaxID=2994951 RepID=UPI0027E4A806|nr:glycosyltransferase [Acidithiobacillus sp. AMEEHan]